MTREESLKILRDVHDKALFSVRNALETLIPELKEDEDEKIRKALIELVELVPDYMFGEIKPNKFISYLEKQKEQKPISFNEPYNPDDYEVVMEGNATGLKRKEQKPAEWNEEDENRFRNLCDIINGDSRWNEASKQGFIDWLKSLRPSWKPSKKQMDALAWYSGNSAIPPTGDKAIQSLYNDLKKLM